MNLEKYLPWEMCNWIGSKGKQAENITLIRGRNMFISNHNAIIDSPFFVTKETLDNVVNLMCRGSMYANQHSLRNGYITLPGGHRAGVVGKAVKDGDVTTHLRDISAVNIRISREVTGAADIILPYIKEGEKIFNTLIISPPSAGKTTVLRDVARQIGNRCRVGLIDEREEIARGKDVGRYTFVMEDCTKSDGIIMMLRSMSPQVILTDEIGTKEDETALKKLLNAGVKMICTAHGYDENDILRREVFKSLITDKVFEKIIVLSSKNGPGTLEKVIDNR